MYPHVHVQTQPMHCSTLLGYVDSTSELPQYITLPVFELSSHRVKFYKQELVFIIISWLLLHLLSYSVEQNNLESSYKNKFESQKYFEGLHK